ncbi:MAG: uroporphyrinogen III methyltransferase [Candidatus Binatia bacterium]|nr:MAG: uroporphyrinogen III methyltransferase [Candidatus Binatia bacterium]
MTGKVYLVGAGPGDPGLLTLRGRRCLEKADVVVYDYLADPSLLRFAPPGAELVCVGKHGGGPKWQQEDIHTLLVERAKAGKTVVRLKGGDPFIFGRGGEEAEELGRHGIPFEVVPGVTAGVAVPAYAGIPLTHRDHSSSVAFLAGYEYPDKAEPAVPWEHLARSVGTLVLFMTTRQLRRNMERLLAAGLDPGTAVALVRWGSRAAQTTIVGTVSDIAEKAEAARIQPPALAVVGNVVRLREKLAWFEQKPLFGRRIVVTRAREQAGELGEPLEELGAEVLYLPAIEILPPESFGPLDAAIRGIREFDLLVFTSANGVRFFFERLDALGRDIRELGPLRLAAIGSETARALERKHLRVDVVPGEFRAEALAEALGRVEGMRILLPRAVGARPFLPRELEGRGARVHEVPAYRVVRPRVDLEPLRRLLAAGEPPLLTFTSSSTVRNFLSLAREEGFLEEVRTCRVACLGPVTAETARESGLRVDVQPETYTIPAFVRAIEELARRGGI